MTRLTFDRAAVKKLIDHSTENPTVKASYTKDYRIGLWLVGDEGIYLMSNSVKTLKGKDTTNFVVYAYECNPKTTADWYDAKVSLFGGDDGVDTLPLKMFSDIDWSKKSPLVINLTNTRISIKG